MDAVSIVNLCGSALSSSNAVVQKYQKLSFKRRRILDCFSMVFLIFRLVLSKNSKGYGTTIMEFWDAAKSLVPRLRGIKPVSSSTFCDARDKLDESIFQELNTNLISDYSSALDESYNWKGHRLFCIDGTKVNFPRELIDVGYSLPNSSSHYPIGLVSCLYQLKTKLPFHFELASHLNERKCASNHLEQLNQGRKASCCHNRSSY